MEVGEALLFLEDGLDELGGPFRVEADVEEAGAGDFGLADGFFCFGDVGEGLVEEFGDLSWVGVGGFCGEEGEIGHEVAVGGVFGGVDFGLGEVVWGELVLGLQNVDCLFQNRLDSFADHGGMIMVGPGRRSLSVAGIGVWRWGSRLLYGRGVGG